MSDRLPSPTSLSQVPTVKSSAQGMIFETPFQFSTGNRKGEAQETEIDRVEGEEGKVHNNVDGDGQEGPKLIVEETAERRIGWNSGEY